MRKTVRYIDWVYCLVMAVVMYVVFPLGRWMDTSPLCTIVFLSFYYAIYAVNRLAVIPLFLRGGKYSVLAAIMVSIAVLMMMGLTCQSEAWPLRKLSIFFLEERKVELTQQRAWLFFLMVETFSLAVSMQSELARQRIRRQEAELARDRAELALYQAQFEPHFIYNSLNTLYGLIVTRDASAEETFMKFIGQTRYMTRSIRKEWVDVEEEIEYLRNYIDLQRLRLDEHTTINLDCENTLADARIAPLILITFVGNALKHGTKSGCDSLVDIKLRIDDNGLYMHIANPIIKSEDKVKEGTGIENCRRRLELIYPYRHSLDISQQDGRYIVNLKIQL